MHEGEGVLFAELRQVLSLIRAGAVRVTPKQGTPTETSVRKLGEALAAPDFELDVPEAKRDRWYDEAGPVRAFAWEVLGQACGWCRDKAGKLELTRAGERVLSGDPADLKQGVERFAGAMAAWPVRRWIPFDEAWRVQQASGHPFEVAHDPWNLYFAEKQYGSLGYAGGEGHLERQYLRAFLFESIATLGLVDVAYVRPHGIWPEFDGWWGTDELMFCSRYDGPLYGGSMAQIREALAAHAENDLPP